MYSFFSNPILYEINVKSHRLLYVLRTNISATNNDQIFQATRDKDLVVAQESHVPGTEPMAFNVFRDILPTIQYHKQT